MSTQARDNVTQLQPSVTYYQGKTKSRCNTSLSRFSQHGKKLCDIRHNVLEGFLESNCVYFLFLFSVLFVFLLVFLFVFLFVCFFWGGMGDNIPTAL